MTRNVFVLLIAILLSSLVPANAQQPTKVPRIGLLAGSSASAISNRVEAFRQGLRELGYVEGKNILIESRYGDGKQDRSPALAAELVRIKVDVIVTGGPLSTNAAKENTTTIPIVMAFHSDPVGSGLVMSLANPGGNITGLSSLSPEITGKQLELLKEISLRLSRVAVFGNSTVPGNAQDVNEVARAAKALGLQVHYSDIVMADDIEPAFRAATKAKAEAILMLASSVTLSDRKQVTERAIKSRLPFMYARPEFVEDGGLMTYGVSINDLFRRAATYVDKILKGRKPADLPVEQPIKFELIINLKAAKQIGLTIPPNVLARADKVIK